MSIQPKTEQPWWNPHPLDKWGQMFLLEVASSAAPPESQASDSTSWSGNVTLPAKDGWQVTFFYDCGELDYIDHFITPSGEKLYVFANDYQSEQFPPVMNWRGPSDTNRFRALLAKVEERIPKTEGARRMEKVLTSINSHMHQGACPKPGCIGECAAIDEISPNRWWAALYIWDNEFNDSARVAKWFYEAGATDVVISHVLYDSFNGDRDGKCTDGVRAWHVEFAMTAEAPQHPTTENPQEEQPWQ